MKSKLFLICKFLVLTASLLLAACASPEERVEKHLATARELIAAGDPDKARLEFRSALQLNEQLPEAWFGLAAIADQKQDWQQAYALSTRVVELDPSHIEARILRARLLFIGGQYADALEMSSGLMAELPEDSAVMALHAGILFRLGQTTEAVELAILALTKNPKEEAASLMLAAASLQENDAERALGFVVQGLAANELSLPLLLMQVKAFLAMGDTEGAEQAYVRALEHYPENSALRLQLVNFYLQQFDAASAEREMRNIVELNSDDEGALNRLLALLNQTKGGDAALAELVARIEARPERTSLRFTQVQLLSTLERDDEATEVLTAIANTAPDIADRHTARAMIAQRLLSEGDEEGALELINSVLADDPRHEEATLLRSGIRLERRELMSAVADLRSLLEYSPSSSQALLLLAKAYELDGAIDLADDTYQRAFETSEQSERYALAYAEFLSKMGRSDRALSVLSASSERYPDNASVLAELAELYLKLGDWLNAERTAERLSELQSQTETVESLLTKVAVARAEQGAELSTLRELSASPDARNAAMTALVRAYIKKGDPGSAHEYLEKVLSDAPDNITAQALRAQLFAVEGDVANARAAYVSMTQSVESVEDVSFAYVGYARFLFAEGDKQDAITILEEAAEEFPDSIAIGAALARFLEKTGDYERAIALYEAVLQKAPNADPVANNLANLLAEHRADGNSLLRALELADRFRQSPIPPFQDTLGWVLFKLERYEDALSLLRSAAAGSPKNGLIQYHLGRALQMVGQYDLAIVAYERAAENSEPGSSLLSEVEDALGLLRE